LKINDKGKVFKILRGKLYEKQRLKMIKWGEGVAHR
jgi:hypothetical protein